MRLALQIVVAVALGFFLMSPLGWFFEIMNWPTFHSWGLMHGGSFSTWPTLALISFVLLSLLPWFRRILDASLLATGALIGLSITGALLVTEPSGGNPVPVYLLAMTFGCSAVLCYLARRPWLVALAVALPMIFFDSQFLMMPWDAVLGYLSFNVLSVTVPITGSAFLGMGAAYAAHRAVRP